MIERFTQNGREILSPTSERRNGRLSLWHVSILLYCSFFHKSDVLLWQIWRNPSTIGQLFELFDRQPQGKLVGIPMQRLREGQLDLNCV
jgi:hypothetical protein